MTTPLSWLDAKRHKVDKIIYHPKWFGADFEKPDPKDGKDNAEYDFCIIKLKTSLGIGTPTIQAGIIGTTDEYNKYVKKGFTV